MDFLMIRFLNKLNDYGLNFTFKKFIDKNKKYFVRVTIKNVPIEADIKIINSTFKKHISTEHVKNGMIVYDVPKLEEQHVAEGYIGNDDQRYIKIDLYNDDYAIKMNIIDNILREYTYNEKLIL